MHNLKLCCCGVVSLDNPRLCPSSARCTSMKHPTSILQRFIESWPGQKTFGVYRFLPLFFGLGAALEFSMIKWTVGQTNFCEYSYCSPPHPNHSLPRLHLQITRSSSAGPRKLSLNASLLARPSCPRNNARWCVLGPIHWFHGGRPCLNGRWCSGCTSLVSATGRLGRVRGERV